LRDEVATEAQGRLAWHAESDVARLLEPTLAALSPTESRAVEYAAFLAPDSVPIPWLRDLVLADFPDLARTGLVDPMATLFKRLERLRLVVPQVQQRGATPSVGASQGDERLARMHRLVQEVIRDRLGANGGLVRQQAIHEHADKRAAWVEGHWGQTGLAWELPCLRDLALRRIDAGDICGISLRKRISMPLMHLGHALDIRELWLRSAAMFQRLYAVDPTKATYAVELLKAYTEMGDQSMSALDPIASQFYRDGLQIAQRLYIANPENAEYARHFSILKNNLGDFSTLKGDRAAARRYYEDGLEIRKRLCATDPQNQEQARLLRYSYNKLGDLAMSADDRAEAQRFYQECLKIAQRLYSADQHNAEYARDLFMTYGRLGDLAKSGGDPPTARRYFEDSLALSRSLAAKDPNNADYQRDLSVGYIKLGDLAIIEGDLPAARLCYSDGVALAVRLIDAAPENAQFARDLSIGYDRLGALAEANGDGAAARRYYEDRLSISKRLAEAAPENGHYARDLWNSYLKLAMLAQRFPAKRIAWSWRRSVQKALVAVLAPPGVSIAGLNGDPEEVRFWWQHARDVLAEMKKKGMLVPREDETFFKQIEQKLGLS
jgi:tetratricopeptide (TPR) repeat protein